MSLFSHIPQEPEDPIYGLQILYKSDARHHKINLSIGILVNEQQKLLAFPTVRRAEGTVYEKCVHKEYLPIDGLHAFTTGMHKLILPDAPAYVAQTIGGTGALYIAARFCSSYVTKKIYLPTPAWVNHPKILKNAGLEVIPVPYNVSAGHCDLSSLFAHLEQAEENSALLLQASCHNPTGIDPSATDWKELARLAKKKKLFTIFDLAYQGLGRGFAEDVASISTFYDAGCEFFVAASCSKNFSLYNERLGALLAFTHPTHMNKVSAAVRKLIRATYSSPPAHGAHVAAVILNDSELKTMWQTEVSLARMTLEHKRKTLAHELLKLNPHANVIPIKESLGLFAMTYLPYDMIVALRNVEAIYMNDDSRINIAAIPDTEMHHIANVLLP